MPSVAIPPQLFSIHQGSKKTVSRVEELNKVVRSMQMSSQEVEACAIISEDSLMIAAALPQHIDEGAVSGISATLHSLGSRAAQELERGELDQVLVHGDDGYVVMCNASDGTLLVVMTNSDAKLGLVFLDMKRAVEHIKKIL